MLRISLDARPAGSPRWPAISRRGFLELGAPLVGLSLADVIRAQAAEPAGNAAPPKSLIVIWTHGGMSQQDTYDLKPQAPPEYRGPYLPIATAVPGFEITEKFPRQARIMNHVSVIRSVNHKNAIHAPSAHWMQTGSFGPTLARNAAQRPSFESVVAKVLGPRQASMPPYVAIPQAEAFGYQGALYLGAAFNPFEVGADPNAKDFSVPNLALPGGLSIDSVRTRAMLLKQFDTLRRDVDKSGVLAGLDTFKARSLELVTGQEVRDAFDISREDAALRDRFGRHLYGQGALLARRLVEAGCRCVTLNTGYWDHHDNIHPALEEHLSPLDAAIATLIEDLDERGMLNDVLIYMAGEFGRTPLINGHAGRDHWSGAFSVVLAGGGIKGGQVVGASEPRGGKVQSRPVMPPDILATLYQALGVPLDTHFVDSSGRPVSIIDGGRPVLELL